MEFLETTFKFVLILSFVALVVAMCYYLIKSANGPDVSIIQSGFSECFKNGLKVNCS